MAPRIRAGLPQVLPDFLARQRWFGGKAHSFDSAEVVETIPIPAGRREAYLVLADVRYADYPSETYALPLVPTGGRRASPGSPPGVLSLRLGPENGTPETILSDALWDKQFPVGLMRAIYRGRRFEGNAGEILASPTQAFRGTSNLMDSTFEPSLLRAEQSNTSIRFGDRFILKFYRRLAEGLNPDLEIGAFLTDKASFKSTPFLYGALDYERPQAAPMTLGILQAYVHNQGDAWSFTLETLRDFLARASAGRGALPTGFSVREDFFELDVQNPPPEVPKLIGEYWDASALLGRRTAELHLALASDSEVPAFRPEPITTAYRQSQQESMRRQALEVLLLLEKQMGNLPSDTRGYAENLLTRKSALLAGFEAFVKLDPKAQLIRIHGDYHLGQVLRSGSDFIIIDFEGEPARPLEERRAKQCSLRDVAGMLRSFHYAAYTALHELSEGRNDPVTFQRLEPQVNSWRQWVSARFLDEYLSVAAEGQFLPRRRKNLSILLRSFLLEKAIYELAYELNNRPRWARLPLRGILQLLEA